MPLGPLASGDHEPMQTPAPETLLLPGRPHGDLCGWPPHGEPISRSLGQRGVKTKGRGTSSMFQDDDENDEDVQTTMTPPRWPNTCRISTNDESIVPKDATQAPMGWRAGQVVATYWGRVTGGLTLVQSIDRFFSPAHPTGSLIGCPCSPLRPGPGGQQGQNERVSGHWI